MPSFKGLAIASVGEDSEQLDLPPIVQGDEPWHGHVGKHVLFLLN